MSIHFIFLLGNWIDVALIKFTVSMNFCREKFRNVSKLKGLEYSYTYMIFLFIYFHLVSITHTYLSKLGKGGTWIWCRLFGNSIFDYFSHFYLKKLSKSICFGHFNTYFKYFSTLKSHSVTITYYFKLFLFFKYIIITSN